MLGALRRRLRTWKRGREEVREIAPDEIFLDSQNLPQFDRHQFEGRLERPISQKTIALLGGACVLLILVFLSKSFALQITEGAEYARRSELNRLRHTLLFGERGVFTDRRGEPLAWNVAGGADSGWSARAFSARAGLAHTLGFLKYPSKDKAGFYYKVDFEGLDGAEKYWSEYVAPKHGLKIVETDALGVVKSESVLKRPESGARTALTIDARISERLYASIASVARERGFAGGAGVMMDVATGDLLALTSFPEYDPQILSDGTDRTAIARFVDDVRKPFLNRVTRGLYTPGSIVKPFIAIAALEEGIIAPEATIVSTGSISVRNPFDPEHPTIFKDWKAHGAVDMRKALAVSSDVYFYEIGGGFLNQKGLGIGNIEKYLRLFGFGEEPGGNDFFGAAGAIPTPAWKQEVFHESWKLGNTYHTAIGQYGFQVTPVQAVRAVAALANGGKLLTPRLVSDEPPAFRELPLSPDSLAVAREGMRQAVLSGTASAMHLPFVAVAAKTGTAELGSAKKFVHSWIIGFFPYEHPRYAFAVLMERGPRANTVGALFVTREMLEWMSVHTPEYLKASL